MQAEDFVNTYRAKTDEELESLMADPQELLPDAYSALLGELARRRITISKPSQLTTGGQAAVNSLTARCDIADPQSTYNFVEEVIGIYRDRFWLFVRVMVPAVILGWFAVSVVRNAAWNIRREIPGGIELLFHRTEVMEIQLLMIGGYLCSWCAFSWSFAAICWAMEQLKSGNDPNVMDAFGAVRRCVRRFLSLSLLLFVLFLMAIAACDMLSLGFVWFTRRMQIGPGYSASEIILPSAMVVLILVISRFALAIPAVVLDNCTVAQAMFRSDELTEGAWPKLAALLAKSVIGGYVAAFLPFWLGSYLRARVQLPGWFAWILTLVSIAAVTVAEPPMFVGFALLYIKNRGLSHSELTQETVHELPV